MPNSNIVLRRGFQKGVLLILVGLAAFSLQASYIFGPSAAIFPSTTTPSFIQSKSAVSGSAKTISVNLGALPTIGNVLYVAVEHSVVTDDDSAMVTDNQGATNYVRMQFQPAGSTTARIYGFCGVVTNSSGTYTITANVSSSAALWIAAAEFKNATCNPDRSSSATGNTHPYSCGSTTTLNAKDIVLAAIGQSFGGGGTNVFTAPTGFTLIESQTNGNNVATGGLAYQIRAATGTFNATFNLTNVVQPDVNSTSCIYFAALSK